MRKASDEQQPPRLFDVVCCDGVRDMRACDVGFGAAAACVRGGVFYLLIYLANFWTESCQIWRKYLLFGAIPSIIGKDADGFEEESCRIWQAPNKSAVG